MKNVSSTILEMFNNKIESISESLFEFALDEKANFIQDNIDDLKESKCEIDDLINMLYIIKECDLQDHTEKLLVKSLYNTYYYGDEFKSKSITESAFNFSLTNPKFTGDPLKNKEYITFLKEIEAFANYTVQLFKNKYKLTCEITDIIDEAGASCQNSEDIRKVINKCLNMIDKYYDNFDEKKYNSYVNKLDKFKQLSKTFNNKYSKVTMAEKEVIDAKIDELIGHIAENYIEDYFKFSDIQNNTPQFDRILKSYNKLKEIDRDMAVQLSNRVVSPLLDWLYDNWKIAIDNLYYMRSLLGIKLKNTNKWRIVHAILKDK